MKTSLQPPPSRRLGRQRSLATPSRPVPATARVGLLLLLVLSLTRPAQAQEPTLPPDAIIADCGDGDAVGDESPSSIDIVGDLTGTNAFWSGVLWFNADFLYFGLRVNGDPSGTGGFDQKAWVALMNVPDGNAFQYQYLISLNGNNTPGFSNDTVEIWENDPVTAKNVSFDPIFNDPAETLKFQQDYTSGGPSGGNDPVCFGGQLACSQVGGSTISGNADYLVFWAVPVSELIDAGAITTASELDEALFLLASSADANNFNKDIINCPFIPPAVLSIDKQVTPDALIQGGASSLIYTIDVTNTSANRAVGVVIEDDDVDGFDACLTFPANSVTIDCQGANGCSGATLVSDPPNLLVQVDELLVSGSISLTIAADAASCPIPGNSLLNVATTFATNAPETSDDAIVLTLLPVELTRFDAVLDAREALLTWETASETNNAGFEIQHRYLDAAFEPLGFVEGYGTTEQPQAYRYRIDDLEPGRHAFRLRQIDFDGTFEYSPEVEVLVEMVERFVIEPVYPNPFNPEAQFRFALQREQQVRVDLYDMLGRRVKALYEGRPPAGQMHTVRIDGGTLPSGLYVVRVQGETFAETQQVLLLK